MTPDFDDAGWTVPTAAFPQRLGGQDWTLEPRPTPMLEINPLPWKRISRASPDGQNFDALLDPTGTTIVQPHSTIEVDLDVGALTTAFVTLNLQAGGGATVELIAAESYEKTPIDIPWMRRKGRRDSPDGQDFFGDSDVITVSGEGTQHNPERYSPFWFRTFRFLRVRVTTTDQPLVIQSITLLQIRYPLNIVGSYSSSNPSHSALWETSVRTLRNCMHDTFEDCPYYEQLQYVMDTRSQSLFSLHLSGDDRLVRRAIADFAGSGFPNGLTESRSPSVDPQYIPGFSLFWVIFIAEHLQYVGDRAFTGKHLDRVDQLLAYFNALVRDDGFVISPEEIAPVWNFVDWTDAWRERRGVPELGPSRANTILTFMFIAALRSAEYSNRHCGHHSKAAAYRDRADEISHKMNLSAAWDEQTGLFRDSDVGFPASQHAQIWAVLSNSVVGNEATQLLQRTMADTQLARCSYAMSLSLFDALQQSGLPNLVDWEPWLTMLDQGLTTWAEDTVTQRSDCHAWGSVPLQHFPRYILGVTPGSPGFDTVTIDPVESSLAFAEGQIPTPRGLVHVRWDQRPDGKGRLFTVKTPPDITVHIPRQHQTVRDMRGQEMNTLTIVIP